MLPFVVFIDLFDCGSGLARTLSFNLVGAQIAQVIINVVSERGERSESWTARRIAPSKMGPVFGCVGECQEGVDQIRMSIFVHQSCKVTFRSLTRTRTGYDKNLKCHSQRYLVRVRDIVFRASVCRGVIQAPMSMMFWLCRFSPRELLFLCIELFGRCSGDVPLKLVTVKLDTSSISKSSACRLVILSARMRGSITLPMKCIS